MAIKPWNEYVEEANRPDVVIPISAKEKLVVKMLTEDQAAEYNKALLAGNNAAKLKALIGEENGERLLELSKTAPVGALQKLHDDILVEFGLREGKGSSTSSD